MKKEKIALILVLGIVGVLVTSLIIDSRVSATPVSLDVQVCDGGSCDFVGWISMPSLDSLLEDLLDEWRTEVIDWESILEPDDFLSYTPYLIESFESDSGVGDALEVLNDLPGHITYYPGFDEDDLGYGVADVRTVFGVWEDDTSMYSSYSYISTSPLGTVSVTVFMYHGAVYHTSFHDF